ncbi:MAG: ATP-binding protein [Deltaproteobacteria bacterium]|nr:ATP-binding protein [Deltaproteobacteria bacterium]
MTKAGARKADAPPAGNSAQGAVPEAEEFERLRRRLQLTNLRVARLYLLLKGSKAPAPDSPELDEDGDPLEDLYVTDQEFQQHLSALSGLPPTRLQDPDAAESLAALDRAAAVLSRRIQAEELAASRSGRTSRFDQLCARCGLSPLDREVLLIGLSPEVDRRYRRVYAYLHDDFTRGIASVGLIVDILAPLLGSRDRLSLLSRFEAGAPLLQQGLLELMAARADDMKPLSQRHVRVSDATAGWLLGVPRMSETVADRARWLGVPDPPPSYALPADLSSKLASVSRRVLESKREVTVFLIGKEQRACRAAADLLCSALKRPVVALEIGAFMSGGEHMLGDVGQALRDAYLFGAALLVVGFPDVSNEEPAAARNLEAVWRRVQTYRGLIVMPAASTPPPSWLDDNRHSAPVAVSDPTYSERVEVIASLLDAVDIAVDVDREEIQSLANRYRMNRHQFQQAVAFGRDLAWARHDEDPELAFDDLVAGAKAQFSKDIGSLARRVEPSFKMPDLVLPIREKNHLTELIAFVERRGQVYEQWGFEEKFPRGTGAKALFFGRSGTGKTMAAEVIAGQLGLDMFKVDLSSVVSKWVGETEKNLGAIFDRAEEAQAVLLFDEADALFGSRTSVGNAVDRYANLETNYLLQRIEEYSGIAILSSNLKQNIDEAFTRRFHFVLEFPFPDRGAREEIWQRAFPKDAPLGDDVDFGFLAERYKFTGGNIKNSILRAAFLGASSDHGEIRMVHILRGVLREYQNLERETTERDFGRWWSELRHLVEDPKLKRREERR